MFAEALEYLITPAEPWARKLGYLKESIAIRARPRRCRSDWAEHLTRSNKFIEAIIKKRWPDLQQHIKRDGNGEIIKVAIKV